jgi:hypothetical protein
MQPKTPVLKIVLIILAVVLVLGLVVAGLMLKALSPFMKTVSGYFPSYLPEGYTAENVIAEPYTGTNGGQGVGVLYFNDDEMISLSQEKAPLICATMASAGKTSEYSAFSPKGFDKGCTFIPGQAGTGPRVYTWGKDGTRFNLITPNSLVNLQEASKIAESLKYGNVRSNIFMVLRIIGNTPSSSSY